MSKPQILNSCVSSCGWVGGFSVWALGKVLPWGSLSECVVRPPPWQDPNIPCREVQKNVYLYFLFLTCCCCQMSKYQEIQKMRVFFYLFSKTNEVFPTILVWYPAPRMAKEPKFLPGPFSFEVVGNRRRGEANPASVAGVNPTPPPGLPLCPCLPLLCQVAWH